jgi:hypothetical protein
MTNGRIQKPCRHPRFYGECGEPASFAAFGQRVLDRLAVKEALRQAKLRERAEAEASEYRALRDRQQRSEGYDANGSPVAQEATAPRWARPMQRPGVMAMPTLLALAMMAVLPPNEPFEIHERRRR